MKSEFIYQDKEKFKNELIAPILAKSSKYQAFATKIAEQEKKWKGIEIDVKNCKVIIEEKKKFDAMKLEEEVYKDSVFFFVDTLKRVLAYVQENNFFNIEKIEKLKLAKLFFEEAKFKKADITLKQELIEELITAYFNQYSTNSYYSEKQREELRILVFFAVMKVSLIMFVGDFSTIPSKEELNKMYQSLEKLFSLVPEPNLLNSMFTLLAFTLDTHKRDILIQKVEEQQKNSQSNCTSFYKTEESQLSGKALISHIIGDFYMQENRNLDKALIYFENCLLDYQKLIAINSLKYLPLLAKAYKYMGHTYSRKENYILAVFFYEKCFLLLKQLHKINPKKYDYDFSEHVFYMIGYHRSKLEDTEKAVELSNHFISNYPNEEELPYLTCYQFRTISFLVFLEMQKA